MPIIDYFVRNKFIIFFVISILIASFTEFPKLFSLNFYFWYLPFYILGCYLSSKRALYLSILKRYGLITLIVFIIWAFLEFFEVTNIHKNMFLKSIVSFFAIFGIGYLSSIKIVRNTFLEKMGDNSFNIYLLNTMFMGGLTFFLKKYLGEDQYFHFFYLIAPFLIFSGIYFPIVLYRIIKKRAPLLAKYIH